MKIQILGTAAAEGWPAPFCRCEACDGARKRGGRDIRSRSGALIDADLKIDFCPDTVSQMQRTGRNLADVRTIVFTHQHSDHIVPTELDWAAPPFTLTPPETPIAVYGNAVVLDMLGSTFGDPAKHNLDLRLLEPFVAATTPTGDTILPMAADHVPGALLLRLTRGGKHILYGHDSGLYPDATIDALSGDPLALALFDCTNGGASTNNRGHMGIDGVLQMVERLRSVGAVTADTTLVATHFSHNGRLLHDALVERFSPHGIQVAYDGIILEIA
jgi:phosphoribosyl 1,2-cyclic phosphate phosphodiesterase